MRATRYINYREGEGPTTAHLAVQVGAADENLFAPIPLGAVMRLVEENQATLPVILLSVSRKELVFKCGCTGKQCTRTLTFKLKAKGIHQFQFSEKDSPI